MIRRLEQRIQARVAGILAGIQPNVEAQVRREIVEHDKANPALRTCYLCKRRHRKPLRLTTVAPSGTERQRWVNAKCWARRTGLPLTRHDGYANLVLYVDSPA